MLLPIEHLESLLQVVEKIEGLVHLPTNSLFAIRLDTDFSTFSLISLIAFSTR